MECEVVPRKRKLQYKKYHQDLSADPQIQELTEKHADDKRDLAPIDRIDRDDVLSVLARYAKDPKLDLYTIAEALNISATSLTKLLKTDEYKDYYLTAKKKRGEMIIQGGFMVASTPFDKIQNGEEVSMVEVASAKLKSNYMLEYGRALNNDFVIKKESSSESGGINITVNTGFKVGI